MKATKSLLVLAAVLGLSNFANATPVILMPDTDYDWSVTSAAQGNRSRSQSKDATSADVNWGMTDACGRQETVTDGVATVWKKVQDKNGNLGKRYDGDVYFNNAYAADRTHVLLQNTCIGNYQDPATGQTYHVGEEDGGTANP